MGAAAYRRGSRLIARQIAADFGLPGEVERQPTPRPADWGSKAQEKALARARSILACSLRLGRTLSLDVLAGTVQMVTKAGEATARAAAQQAMEEKDQQKETAMPKDSRDLRERAHRQELTAHQLAAACGVKFVYGAHGLSYSHPLFEKTPPSGHAGYESEDLAADDFFRRINFLLNVTKG